MKTEINEIEDPKCFVLDITEATRGLLFGNIYHLTSLSSGFEYMGKITLLLPQTFYTEKLTMKKKHWLDGKFVNKYCIVCEPRLPGNNDKKLGAVVKLSRGVCARSNAGVASKKIRRRNTR